MVDFGSVDYNPYRVSPQRPENLPKTQSEKPSGATNAAKSSASEKVPLHTAPNEPASVQLVARSAPQLVEFYTHQVETQRSIMLISFLTRVLDRQSVDIRTALNEINMLVLQQSGGGLQSGSTVEIQFLVSALKTLLEFSNSPLGHQWIQSRDQVLGTAQNRDAILHTQLQQLFAKAATLDAARLAVLRETIPLTLAPLVTGLMPPAAPPPSQVPLTPPFVAAKPTQAGWNLEYDSQGIRMEGRANNTVMSAMAGGLAASLYLAGPTALYGFLYINGMYVPVVLPPEALGTIQDEAEGVARQTIDMVVVTDSSASFPVGYQNRRFVYVIDILQNESEDEFIQLYRELLNAGVKRIYSVHVNAKVSPAFRNATAAAYKVSAEKIRVYNSKSFSLGLGLVVQQVADAIANGRSHFQIEQLIHKCIQNQRHFIVVNSLDQIERFVSIDDSMEKRKADLYNFKPLMSIHGDHVEVIGCYLDLTRAKNALMSEVVRAFHQRQSSREVAIEYAGLYYQCLTLERRLREELGQGRISIYPAGPYTSKLYGDEILGVSVI
jgi:DegV family protein with EDD domain